MTRILIAEDNAQVRRALRVCLEMNPSWEVCGEAADGYDAVGLAQRLKSDIVLLDYAMPEMNGLEAARLISSSVPTCVLILFTMFSSYQLIALAHQAGVREVISKDVGAFRRLCRLSRRLPLKQPETCTNRTR
jgi:DNA-binding NarL/FixJ family response regulator